jgi:hypothetical protein
MAATESLPHSVAGPMERALAGGTYRIRSGRYEHDGAVCPLGTADAFAASRGQVSVGEGEAGYGGHLLRFAVAFDLYAEEAGLDAAVELVRTTLARQTPHEVAPRP